MTATSYGTWNNNVEPFTLTVEQTVSEALGEFADEYDIPAIAAEYREQINAALPDSVSLCCNEFIGPYRQADTDFDGYPITEDGALDIKAIVASVDFWAIAERHDQTA